LDEGIDRHPGIGVASAAIQQINWDADVLTDTFVQ
jgi:hypothetical protein